ncbi:MAG TPA: heme biosynthesis HemY N-terminal domain-containing protein [Xanthobacteraceae bacterium]|nr:heme biosynthesis HemY N-terminal domain-containing protein [Xanthobacteraceae bacterium]
MIRVIIYLIIVAALAYGAVWLAERPGEVAITWQGERIDTSVMVLAAAIAAVAVAVVFFWSILRALLNAPAAIARYRRERRGERGYRAVSRGLIAVGSGDARGAQKFTAEALRIAPREPLTLLLTAQSAQLSGDRDAAVATFQELAARDDTRVLGLHGLFVEAHRRHDHAAALGFAEAAARHDSTPVWAAQAVLEFRCVAGDWTGALERLDRNLKEKLIDRRTYRRQRAVLITAQAQALAQTEPARAAALAREAAKLAPDLVPAATLAGRLLGEAGERRKASRIIERAWRENPHPDLAAAYAALRPGDSARQRLSRVEALAAKGPADAEAALAVARAALDAQEFSVARAALAPYTAAPRKRVAALMAELEMAQGDEGRAREWMARALNARRDPAWTADAFVSDHWLPISPVSGRLDAFEWKDPLAGEDHGPVIEHAAEAASVPATVATPRPAHTRAAASPPPLAGEGQGGGTRKDASVQAHPLPTGAPRDATRRGDPVAGEGADRAWQPDEETRPGGFFGSHETERPEEKAERPDEKESRRSPFFGGGARERHRRAAATADKSRAPRPEVTPVAPPIIPLVHAPDDPGPNGDAPREPETDAPPSEGWRRIRALFK